MSSVFSWLPADGWQRLLCDAIWQGTLIAALGWLAARFLVRQSAARAWLLLLTLTACAAVPLASLAARSAGFGLLPARVVSASQVSAAENEIAPDDSHNSQGLQSLGFSAVDESLAAMPLSAPIGENANDFQAALPSETPLLAPAPVENLAGELDAANDVNRPFGPNTSTGRSKSYGNSYAIASTAWLLPGLAILWLSASAILAVRLTISLFATRHLLTSAKAVDDATLLAAVSEAARRVGLKRLPEVLTSNSVATPMVWALGKPRLLIPEVGESLRDSQSRFGETRQLNWPAVFAHELAHVVRGDGWFRLWVELIRIALPLEPLVWVLRRSFHTACEEACDDWAIATGADPVDLAAAFAAWLNRPRIAAPLAAIGMSSTKARMLRLLSLREKPVARLGRRLQWSSVPVAFLVITGLALAQSPAPYQTLVRPKQDGAKSAEASKLNFEGPNDLKTNASSISPDESVEKAIAADALIILYERQIVDEQAEIERLKKAPDLSSPDYPMALQERIDDLKNRIEKRKAELRPLILQELQEEKANAQRRQSGAASYTRAAAAPYVIQPPDTLLIDPVQLVPRKPVRIAPFDKVRIVADPTTTKLDNPISGTFQVDSSGEVVLGPAYGAVKISGLTRREAEEAVTIQLQATLKDPQVSLILDESRLENGIKGEHQVGADGNISLGAYGTVDVEGLTITQARETIENQLSSFFAAPKVAVQVKSGSSKVYYVFSWPADGGKTNIERIPITGNDTVLDAIANLKSGIELSGAKLFIQRPIGGGKSEMIEVNLDRALEGAEANRQILPGDRIFVNHRPPTASAVPPTPAGKSIPKSSERKDGTKSSALPPTEKNMVSLPPYVIEPPDILMIDVTRLVPKEPYQIQPLNILQVDADPIGTKYRNDELYGPRTVEPGGMLNLGAAYGKVKVGGMSLEEAKAAVLTQLKKTLRSPRVAVTFKDSGGKQQVAGEHLVGPDGTINLNISGQVYVAGMTIAEASQAVEKRLSEIFVEPKVSVDIYAYNSKVYYVISKGANHGDNIQRFPITGNDTVLDAVSQTQGLGQIESAKIWIARPSPNGVDQILDVNWDAITHGTADTNYQIFPGDRVFIDPKEMSRKGLQRAESPEPALSGTPRVHNKVKTPPTFSEPPQPMR